jgi:scyllo-inositol 2-dehydrogenase (NADP+)
VTEPTQRTNGPIRAAVVGYGTGGRVFHAPLIDSNDRFLLRGIVTGSADRQKQARARYPKTELLNDAHALLERAGEFDLVVVSTPPSTHYSIAYEALRRGLDVVVDKPLVVTASEGRRLIDYAAAHGRRLTVFHNRRLDGDFLTVRRLIAEGRVGEVRRFESRFEWWKPQEPKAWKAHAGAEHGGGILYDLGPHLLDQALQLFGPVDDVHAELARHRGGAGADDEAFVSLRHRGGVRSHLWMSSLAPLARARFTLLGSDAGFTKFDLDVQESQLGSEMSPLDDAYGIEGEDRWGILGVGSDTVRIRSERGRYPDFYSQLAAAILEDASLPVDPADALGVIELIEQIYRDTTLEVSSPRSPAPPSV